MTDVEHWLREAARAATETGAMIVLDPDVAILIANTLGGTVPVGNDTEIVEQLTLWSDL